jgi:mono/diheme cytochrome c family protein
MRCATALAALALAITAGGCGSASTPPPSASASAAARTLFAGSCGGCHTLTGHDTASHQGGDLLGVHLHRRVALQFAREMPVPHRLSQGQLSTIVDYIAAVQRGNR